MAHSSLEIVTHLLDHQDRALDVQKGLLGSAGLLSETQVRPSQPTYIIWPGLMTPYTSQIFALIPLVLESYAIYSVITYFLKQLVHRSARPLWDLLFCSHSRALQVLLTRMSMTCFANVITLSILTCGSSIPR